jgi:[protein-PII] uridylyltransferase
VHVFTVDRHSVECAVRASALLRRVARPDLLLIGALLHDIGKGQRRGDHSIVGARTARELAGRLGLVGEDVETVEMLVREHLTLVDAATRRDIDDPATAAAIVASVRSLERLDLLAALTEADALAAGPAAWTPWRSGLVATLVARVRAALEGAPPPGPVALTAAQRELADAGNLAVQLERLDAAWEVTVVAPDQRGLLAAVAGVLALHRLSVRSATMRTDDGVAVDVWHVEPEYGDEPTVETLREDIGRALERSIDVADLLATREAARRSSAARPGTTLAPRVDVIAEASAQATVLEVRASDRLGLLHRLGRALSLAGTSVRSAKVTTIGSEILDVFYVVDEDGRPLTAERAREVARILKDVAG